MSSLDIRLDRPPTGAPRLVVPARWRESVNVLAVFAVLATVPLWLPGSWIFDATVGFVWALAALSLVVLARATGAASLAQTTFMGIGAYSCAWLFTDLKWPFLAAAIMSIVITVPIGMVFAFPSLRLRGLQVSVLTLAIGLAGQAFIFDPGAPFAIGGGSGAGLGHTPTPLGVNLLNPNIMFWSMLIITGVIVLAVVAVLDGPVGFTWRATRTGNAVAAASGIRIARYQLLGYGLSSAIAAVAGVMLITVEVQVQAVNFAPESSIILVVLAVIVGIDNIRAALFAGVVLGVSEGLFPAFNISGNWLNVASGVVLVIILMSKSKQQDSGTS